MTNFIATISIVINNIEDNEFVASYEIAEKFNIDSYQQFIRFGALHSDGLWFWKCSQLFMAAGWLKVELEKQGYCVTIEDKPRNIKYLELL